MNQTRWWKCDLQVATPAWDFRLPPGTNYSLETDEGINTFLEVYMSALSAAGIEVIALADHNTSKWIDFAKAAGNRHGIVVFPGCEITTQTGADGAHIIIIGDVDKTGQDFDRLIHGQLGFGGDHPPFFNDSNGKDIPASSSKNLVQILDCLPDGYLAIAPHVLNDNGIASAKTVKGDIRWKAFHHERLAAVDPGDCSGQDGDSFNQRFRRRELDNLPRLKDLAFVSTSDAYSLDDLGSNFTWIRMGEVNLEALRQAFLDHESRVICDWSSKLNDFPEKNPNNVRHAWIEDVELAGTLGNSASPLRVTFHPGLNVLIGGRGSGKSSIVGALREIYSGTETLPKRLKEDADAFSEAVFAGAKLKSAHHVQESQAVQVASWSKPEGRTTEVDGIVSPTTFPVTVISQKELFERAAGDKNDPFLSSRSLLALIDGSIGFSLYDKRTVTSFGRQLEDARVIWGNATRSLTILQNDLRQLPALRQQLTTLQGQADAFSSPEVRHRLERINGREKEHTVLEKLRSHIQSTVDRVSEIAESTAMNLNRPEAREPFAAEYESVVMGYQTFAENWSLELKKLVLSAEERLALLDEKKRLSPWHQDLLSARGDFEVYKTNLAEKGLSGSEFSRIQDDLGKMRVRIVNLEELENRVPEMTGHAVSASEALDALISRRRKARSELLLNVESHSGRLRFKTKELHDTAPWIYELRSLASFRADAYHDDVRVLANWLWNGEPSEINHRLLLWQQAMASGDMSQVQILAELRQPFAQRLESLEEAVRLRMATLIPDDVVEMEFLKEDGDPSKADDWQSITQASPGQRTAAMLAFVLHHGREPLVLDQPEDDLDSEWISKLVVKELRKSRWHRQLIVVSHNANIPVLGDAEQVTALENRGGSLRVRTSEKNDGTTPHAVTVLHVGPVESDYVRRDIQSIMEGGVAAFVRREQKYNNETREQRLKS